MSVIYHSLHFFLGFILRPAEHLNASENSSIFDNEPIILKKTATKIWKGEKLTEKTNALIRAPEWIRLELVNYRKMSTQRQDCNKPSKNRRLTNHMEISVDLTEINAAWIKFREHIVVQPYSWFDFYFPLAFLKTSKYGENWTSASIRHLKYQKNHSRQKGLMILDI